jgi:hypothetical protein
MQFKNLNEFFPDLLHLNKLLIDYNNLKQTNSNYKVSACKRSQTLEISKTFAAISTAAKCKKSVITIELSLVSQDY